MNDLVKNQREGQNLQFMNTSPQNAQVMISMTERLAEVQGRMMLAKQFPRDIVNITDVILTQFQRVELAEVALYQYARGGSDICDLSIRAAEAIANSWTNLDMNWGIVRQTAETSECVAYCWDVQTNTKKSISFTVPHYRSTKKGRYKVEDDRDIYELCANQASRRLRACILSMIPRDIIERVKEQIKTTLQTHIDVSPERIKKMIAAFGKIGIKKELLETRIQRRIDTITPAQMLSLMRIFNSISDGMSSKEDWFPEENETGVKTLAQMAKSASGEKAAKKEEDTSGNQKPEVLL